MIWENDGCGTVNTFVPDVTYAGFYLYFGLPWWLRDKKIDLPVQEMLVPSPGQEDPWREKQQPPSVFLLGESPRTEKPGGLQSMGSQASSDLASKQQYLWFTALSEALAQVTRSRIEKKEGTITLSKWENRIRESQTIKQMAKQGFKLT